MSPSDADVLIVIDGVKTDKDDSVVQIIDEKDGRGVRGKSSDDGEPTKTKIKFNQHYLKIQKLS